MPTSPTARLIPQLRRAVLASDALGPTDGRLLSEFVRTGDPDAFAALVRRHGPMVLGVCRRVVGDVHLAEDAFQAAFLVLARRAAAVRPGEQVGSWLYGVAYRTALKARAGQARRRAHEKQVTPMPHPPVFTADVWPDLLPVLDAELARLPDRLRLPVVLCDLEGRPQREVARQLGLPPTTLANRLATARRTLARRLTDRGIVLSGGAVAAVLTAKATAAVPPTLAAAAVRVGTVAAGSAAGAVPAHLLQLSDGVIRMLAVSKFKATAVVVAVLTALAGGVGTGTLPALQADDAPGGPPAAATATRPALGPHLSDDQFLRRISLDLRGTVPTALEFALFRSDPDPLKRKKVVDWLVIEVRSAASDPVALWRSVANVRGPGDPTRPVELGYDLITRGRGLVVLNEVFNSDRSAVLELFWPPQPGAANDTEWRLELRDIQVKPKAGQGDAPTPAGRHLWTYQARIPTDEDFLRRVCQDAFGRSPTDLERQYFLADTNPDRRTRLVDLVLKDPAVARRVGSEWKQKVLESGEFVVEPGLVYPGFFSLDLDRSILRSANREPVPARLESLLQALLDGKRADEAVLDTLSAATLGRLPTESERKLALAAVGRAADKSTAWREVLAALAGTEEARKHAAGLQPDPAKK
jgi:RNA polymerase sigma factor (sigma-70 family)